MNQIMNVKGEIRKELLDQQYEDHRKLQQLRNKHPSFNIEKGKKQIESRAS